MNQALVECVPNFSEGRDEELIKQITDAIESVDGIKLLDVDPGFEMNRTVVTFIGNPIAVEEAAFCAIRKAAELIDMSKHKGSHPRMGATDVCPFVPVSGISTDECVALSKNVARRVGEELGIPVYLYEKSAQKPERQNLAIVRQGEYEGLESRLKNPEWKPDYGPVKFNAKAGATVMGVREFLIAYNINLNTRESKHATDIAFELREKGRSARRGNIKPYYYKGEEILKYKIDKYPCGSCDFDGTTIKDTIEHCKNKHKYNLTELLILNGIDPQKPEGESVKKPGLFNYCKAIGWMVPEYNRAQISINLTNYKETSMHAVLEATRSLAAERGIIVTGSEIVGMVPYPALLEAGKFYLGRQGKSTGIPVKDILDTAVQSLGLSDVSPFNIEERVLGLPDFLSGPLVNMKVRDFIDEVSRETPAPGGGSIAALAGALGAALSSMVSNLSANKRQSENVDKILNEASEKIQKIKNDLIGMIDADTNAFNAFIEAKRLPSRSADEKKIKFEAEQKGLKEAILVPLKTAELSLETIKIANTVIEYGNPNSISDAGVGANIAYVGVQGGIFNVLINLKDIQDGKFSDEMQDKCKHIKKEAKSNLKNINKKVEEAIAS